MTSQKEKKLSQKPRINTSFYIVPMTNNEFQLRNDERIILLEGKKGSNVLTNLLTLLNGNLTVEEIIEKFKEDEKDDVISFINKLNNLKVLEDLSIKPPNEITLQELKQYDLQLEFFSQFTLNKYEVQNILKQSKVALIGLGMLGSKIAETLTISGIGNLIGIDSRIIDQKQITFNQLISQSELTKYRTEVVQNICNKINPHLKFIPVKKALESKQDLLKVIEGSHLVILAEDELRPQIFDLVNEACIESDITWTSCGSHGFKGFIGPTVVPHETACYKCFETRYDSNIQYYREFQAFKDYLHKKNEYKEYGKLVMLINIISDCLSLEVIKLLTKFMPPKTLGQQMMFDFLTMTNHFHNVVKLPRCTACGLPSRNIPTTSPWS